MTQIGIEFLSKFCQDNGLRVFPIEVKDSKALFQYRIGVPAQFWCDINDFLARDHKIFGTKDYRVSGEANIILNLLKLARVDYQLEYSFKDLKGKGNSNLRFDFAIFQGGALDCLIEYDSLLHFQKESSLVKDAKGYHERDLKKNNYCLARGIKLYRISYWDLEDLKTYKDLFQDKFLVKTQWHNYNIMASRGLV